MAKDLRSLEETISMLLSEVGVDLVDVELRQGVLSFTVTRSDGLDLESLTTASRSISDFLDANEALAPEGSYELEVSSPGLERRLRRPEHFVHAVGQSIAVRTKSSVVGSRRFEGHLVQADVSGISVMPNNESQTRELSYIEIDRAHTVFDWKAALAADKRTRSSESGVDLDIADEDDDQLTSQAPEFLRETSR